MSGRRDGGGAEWQGPWEVDERLLESWGRRLGKGAAEGSVFVALYGPLGSGKTRLVQAACRGAGVVEDVLSPTFTLLHIYAAPGADVFHCDLYRLRGPEELPGIGWDALLGAGGPVFVEWADRAGDWLPGDRWEIRLGMGGRPDTRRVEVRALGGVPDVPVPGVERSRAGEKGPRAGAGC